MEYKVGDIIKAFGLDYEVRDVLKGGFGIVYIVYSPRKRIEVVKSFQDKFFYREDKIADEVVRAFYREAEVWVRLGRHENIVEAFFVGEVRGRPHIFMKYVDDGNLEDRLVQSRLSVPETLFFAIQFCDGMVYANSVDLGEGRRGVVHRDIKPKNIMLTKEGVLKITDFGLVKAMGAPNPERLFGTPEYMSPEQFETMDVDTRADIYSFGVVLYEMLTGRKPFWTEEEEERWRFCEKHHKETAPLPPRQIDPSIPEELENTVLKCLEKKPKDRYQFFKALREELMEVYRSRFGQIPEVKKRIRNLTATEVHNKGISLRLLGRLEEAIQLFDRALQINPRLVRAWVGKGWTMHDLDRCREAIECFDRALEIDPEAPDAWVGRGMALARLGRHEEAIECYDKALEIDTRSTRVWVGRGMALARLGRHEKAIECYDKALEIDPEDAVAWYGKGSVLAGLEPFVAILCFDRALEIHPRSAHVWCSRGMALARLGRHEKAIECYDRALEIDPSFALAWYSKGMALYELGARGQAERCARKAVELDPSLRKKL